MLDLEKIIAFVNSKENRQRVSDDYNRYIVYNGQLKELIQTAIQKEFVLPETVRDMIARIIPINITKKISDKLAAVYRESPIRYPVDEDEIDQETLDFFVEEMSFNRLMKHANRMFKLCKHVLLEPYVCAEGEPRLRVLPSHTYTPYSDDAIEPNKPTVFVKHIKIDVELNKTRYAVWSKDEHWIVDGQGAIVKEEMSAMNNPEGINPYGELPFIYIKDSDDLLVPISDDDLISLQLALCILATDLAFASKFQCWSIVYLIGVENEKISFNPNSVITLPHNPGTERPEIGTVKPTVDSDAMLRQMEALVALLLTTKNLSVGSVSGQLNPSSSASGIAKLIDQSDTTEDRSDQIAFFASAEKEFWWLFAHSILPVWVANGQLNPEYVKLFSDKFELGILFPDPQPMISDKDKLDVEVTKLDNGLTTKWDVVKQLNPDLSDYEIDAILADINKEKVANVKEIQKQMADEQSLMPEETPPQFN